MGDRVIAAQLVLCDPEADRGCTGNCRRIESLVKQLFAPDALRIVTMSRFVRGGGAEPDLVVLRAPAGRPLIEILRPLREAWRSTAVLGAVCNVAHDVADLIDSLRH